MAWEVFSTGNTTLGFIGSVLTVLGIIWGVAVAGRHLSVSNAESHLGSISLVDDAMGYFVSKVSMLWILCPLAMPKPQPRQMLTVSGMIEAGDEGFFSSSMFNWMPPDYNRVSWKPFFEAFYREYVWACERPCFKPDMAENHHHAEYVKRARYDVLRAKWDVECPYTNPVISEIFFGLTRCSDWLKFMYKRPTQGVYKISPFLKKIEKIDPHLLYYKWNLPSMKDPPVRYNSDPESCNQGSGPEPPEPPKGPLLVRSVRPLKRLGDGWDKKQPLKLSSRVMWIFDSKPCVELFAEELTALTFILGIPLHDKYSSREPGAFGTVFTSRKAVYYNSVRLAHSRWDHGDHLGGGSGYSTIFAKHMACGCIPFGQSLLTNKQLITRTIVVLKDTEYKPDQKFLFVDKFKGTEYLAELPRQSWKYLSSLPSTSQNWYYVPIKYPPSKDIKEIIQKEPEPGDIYSLPDTEDAGKPGAKASRVGCWSEAVAGIAFGGLVPMAADHVVEAVSSVVGGGIETSGEFQSFMDIVSEIYSHATKRVGVPAIPLFGEDIVTLAGLPEDMRHLYEYEPTILDKKRTAMENVAILNPLITVLEYLIGLAEDPSSGSDGTDYHSNAEEQNARRTEKRVPHVSSAEGPRFTSGEKQGLHDSSLEERKVDEAFKACVRKIEFSMKGNGKGTDSEVKGILNHIKDKIHNNKAVHCGDCGDMAWCIIKAWTTFVKRVSWPEEGIPSDKTIPLQKETSPEKVELPVEGAAKTLMEQGNYVPVPPEQLPYVSAWE